MYLHGGTPHRGPQPGSCVFPRKEDMNSTCPLLEHTLEKRSLPNFQRLAEDAVDEETKFTGDEMATDTGGADRRS